MGNFKKPDIERTNVGANAILITQDNQLLLQERDKNPNLNNPGLIGVFGGTINSSETIESGLARELEEEIGISIKGYPKTKLGVFKKTKKQDGADYIVNVFVIRNIPVKNLKINEGKPLILDNNKAILENPQLARITKLALGKYFEK